MSTGLKILLIVGALAIVGFAVYTYVFKQSSPTADLNPTPTYNQASAKNQATGKLSDIMSDLNNGSNSERGLIQESDGDATSVTTGDATTINAISQDNYANQF